jgi:hypothetical protein
LVTDVACAPEKKCWLQSSVWMLWQGARARGKSIVIIHSRLPKGLVCPVEFFKTHATLAPWANAKVRVAMLVVTWQQNLPPMSVPDVLWKRLCFKAVKT